VAPAGSASTVRDHVLPFQCSAIGSCLVAPSAAAPTAQQLDVLAQDTALRNVSSEAAPGPVATRHREPFQRSIRTVYTPAASWLPTAQQSLARGQATPFRNSFLMAAPGAAMTLHAGVTVSTTARADPAISARIVTSIGPS